ncbi:MAG: PilZ domain-containing protein [Thermodesulfobacteriota bacterium]
MKKFIGRKHERINSLNLLNYSCVDQKTEQIIQGMGRTLNVSQGGILLETRVPMYSHYSVALTIGLEDEMIDIDGQVIYCREGGKGKYESGIEFKNINETSLRILNKYIVAFREHQKKTGGSES